MTGHYNASLVVISLIVAVLASYTALDVAGRVATAKGNIARWWLAGGAIAMGLGIWSMHFIGMLAFDLPIPIGYDLAITLYSLTVSIGASAFALWLVSRPNLFWHQLLGGALLMGLGIATMHYLGMAALEMHPSIDYDPASLLLSIVLAAVAAGVALWIAFRLRREQRNTGRLRALASLVMGLAIIGMHYHRDGGRELCRRCLRRRRQGRRHRRAMACSPGGRDNGCHARDRIACVAL